MTGSGSPPSRRRNMGGFALIEVLISVTILSIVMLSVISGVLSCIYVISENGNYTRAMMIAKSKMNEFLLNNSQGMDLDREQIPEYAGFYYSRKTVPYEHPMLPFPVKKTEIIVTWKSNRSRNPYKITYVYAQ